MCFAPQRRALFSTSQLPKVVWDLEFLILFTWKCAWRHNGVCFFDISTSKSGLSMVCFEHFDLEMCFALFSTYQRPKVVRTWCVLCILTWKCASRHNSVQFFISHLASWLRTRRFSEVPFRPSGAPNHWKNTVNRDFPTSSRTCIFSLLTFSISYLLTSWDSSHLCFSISTYCRKFDF